MKVFILAIAVSLVGATASAASFYVEGCGKSRGIAAKAGTRKAQAKCRAKKAVRLEDWRYSRMGNRCDVDLRPPLGCIPSVNVHCYTAPFSCEN